MSVRLTVRNPLNNKWLDQCNSEYFFRDGQNQNWVRFLPDQTSVRDSGNSEWLDVDCSFDSVLDDPCSNLSLLSNVACPLAISITQAGSGNGQGSNGEAFDILTGYPPGYDLPDAGQVGFGLEALQGSFENKVISRPGIDFTKESYGSEAINTFYGKGTYANPSYLHTHTMSNGSAITETIYELGQSRGIFEILYASYATGGVSIDVYYLGALFASTCGRVTGRGKLEFALDTAIGAGEDRVMVRVRGDEDTRWLFNIHGPKASIGLAAFEPGNSSHLASIRNTEYVGTPLFPAPAHSRVYPFENRLPDGQYWYEYTHEIGLLNPSVGPHILNLNFETWDNEDWVEVYHGSKRIASTFKYLSEDGLLRIVFDAYRFSTPVPDIVVKVMAKERTRDADIISQEYMLFDSNTAGYKENRWPCETPTDGITSAGHYSTEDHFQMNAAQLEGVASIKIVGTNPETQYTASVFDKVGGLIQVIQGKGTNFLSWFKLQADPNIDNMDEISVRIDAPLDAGWNYEVGCYIPVLSVRIDDIDVPACPEQDDVLIAISDTTVAEGSQAIFNVTTNFPVGVATTLNYTTSDLTASSVAGEMGEVNPYPLYFSSNAEVSGGVYKDDAKNYTLLIDADAGRFYDPIRHGSAFDYFFIKDSGVQEDKSVASYNALPVYHKMLVNMMQDRLGPLNSSHKILIITHQRVVEGIVPGNNRRVMGQYTLMDVLKSLGDIYGMEVDLRSHNSYGVSENSPVGGSPGVIASSYRTGFPQYDKGLAYYDIIVKDPYVEWTHYRNENTDVNDFADLENKVFTRESPTTFGLELANAVNQSSTPMVVILSAGISSFSGLAQGLTASAINAKDVINALGIKSEMDVLNQGQSVTYSGDVPIETITDLNGLSSFLFENISPLDVIQSSARARVISQIVLSSVTNGVVSGASGSSADYQQKSGTVTIPAGSSTAEIHINTYSDTISDNGEQFNVIISNPSSGAIADDTGIATISEGAVDSSRNDVQVTYAQNIIGRSIGKRGFTITNYPAAIVGFVLNSSAVNMSYAGGALQTAGRTSPTESVGSIAVFHSSKSAENTSDLPLSAGTTTIEAVLGSFDFDPSKTYEYKWIVTQGINTVNNSSTFLNGIEKFTSYLEVNANNNIPAGSYSTYSADNTELSIQFKQIYSTVLLDGSITASVEIFIRDDSGVEQKSDPIPISIQVSSQGTVTDQDNSYGGGCIATDTIMYMEDNTTKTAINIQAGDRIIGYTVPGMIDENTPGWKDWTTNSLAGGQEEVVTVKSSRLDWFREHYIINSDLRITKQHLIFVQTDNIWSWKDIRDVVVGDNLLGRNGDLVYVGTLARSDSAIDVIVLDVEEIDTYFAGTRGVLVHNLEDADKF